MKAPLLALTTTRARLKSSFTFGLLGKALYRAAIFSRAMVPSLPSENGVPFAILADRSTPFSLYSAVARSSFEGSS